MNGAKPRYFARKVARDWLDQRIGSLSRPRKTRRVYLRIGAQLERDGTLALKQIVKEHARGVWRGVECSIFGKQIPQEFLAAQQKKR